MRLVDCTLFTPEENLAFDEALIDEAEAAGRPLETLRFWESSSLFVVVGSCGRLSEEVFAETCLRDGVPVLRRHSGGGAILQAPGCLNFSLVLSLESRPGLRGIHASYRFILERTARALGISGLEKRGTSDLALHGRKVSGNAQRRKRRSLLHHGTLLYDFVPGIMEAYLPPPPREPDYRCGRPHEAFLANLPLPLDVIKTRVAAAWGAHPRNGLPLPSVTELVKRKYANSEWIRRL